MRKMSWTNKLGIVRTPPGDEESLTYCPKCDAFPLSTEIAPGKPTKIWCSKCSYKREEK